MRHLRLIQAILFVCLLASASAAVSYGQTGNSGVINGTVTDPSGAVVAGATVTIHNPISGLERTTTTDASGNFSFTNIPFNPYHMTVTAPSFAPHAEDVEVRSTVAVPVKVLPGACTMTSGIASSAWISASSCGLAAMS